MLLSCSLVLPSFTHIILIDGVVYSDSETFESFFFLMTPDTQSDGVHMSYVTDSQNIHVFMTDSWIFMNMLNVTYSYSWRSDPFIFKPYSYSWRKRMFVFKLYSLYSNDALLLSLSFTCGGGKAQGHCASFVRRAWLPARSWVAPRWGYDQFHSREHAAPAVE